MSETEHHQDGGLVLGAWRPEVHQALLDLINAHGINSPGYDPERPPLATIDCDETLIHNDLGEAMMRFMITRRRLKTDRGFWYTIPDNLGRDAIQAAYKAVAGRAMDHKDRVSGDSGDTEIAMSEHGLGTVACVSGFLVNLPHRTVKLVTPCRACEHWPKGYRVYEEASFSTAREYREILGGMITRHMPESLPADTPLAFRSDLEFVPGDDFFELKGEVTTHRVKGLSYLGDAAPIIAEGGATPSDVIARLMADGADIFSATQVLQDLFNLGFIEDDPAILRDGPLAM